MFTESLELEETAIVPQTTSGGRKGRASDQAGADPKNAIIERLVVGRTSSDASSDHLDMLKIEADASRIEPFGEATVEDEAQRTEAEKMDSGGKRERKKKSEEEEGEKKKKKKKKKSKERKEDEPEDTVLDINQIPNFRKFLQLLDKGTITNTVECLNFILI